MFIPVTPVDCPVCHRDMSRASSDLFCSEPCQTAWFRTQAVPLDLFPDSVHGVTPDGTVVTVGGPVPTREQIAAMHGSVRRWLPTTDDTLKALARVAAGLRRLT
jgi:hypothetical protein